MRQKDSQFESQRTIFQKLVCSEDLYVDNPSACPNPPRPPRLILYLQYEIVDDQKTREDQGAQLLE